MSLDNMRWFMPATISKGANHITTYGLFQHKRQCINALRTNRKNRPFGVPLLCRKCVRQVYRTAYRDYRNRGVAGQGLLLARTDVRVENQHTYPVLPLVKTEITYVIKGRINSLTWPSVWTISAEIPPHVECIKDGNIFSPPKSVNKKEVKGCYFQKSHTILLII